MEQSSRNNRTVNWTFIVLAVIAPIVLSVAVGTLFSMNTDRLPQQIGTHWGLSGGPDGFSSPLVAIWVLGAIASAFPLINLVGATNGNTPFERTIFGVPILATWGLMLGLMFAIILPNLDQAQTYDAQPPVGYVLAGVVGGAVWAILASVLPKQQPLPAADTLPPNSAPQGPPSEPTTVTAGKAMKIVILGLLVSAVVMPALGIVELALLFGVIAVVITPLLRLTISVGESAVTIRSFGGLLISSVPLAAISDARVKRYSDGGGLGVQMYGKTTVYALRTGPAVAITVSTGRRIRIVLEKEEQAEAIVGDINRRIVEARGGGR